ncbi:13122_t:CDS:2, partial [Ambispora gerdemannii]
EMYKKVNETFEELNHRRNLLEDIFKCLSTNRGGHQKSKSQKFQVLTAIEEMEKWALVFIGCNKREG